MHDPIILTSVNFALSPAHREELLAKFNRILRHRSSLVRARIFLEGDYSHHTQISYTARATIELRGEEIFVSSQDEHLYPAVHALVDKMERALTESQQRRLSRHRESPRRASDDQPEITSQLPA